ncbi:RNA-guided endonuclease InsQ/TnpB family protein [Streptomyces violarus]|uniref:RNA-guided endonuclease InsQ/TnpB family protein n=1 Tax=Streptomyces violarus TaxID=67380 RepID=UPI0021C01F4E|nr:zinc ribbon domain-containing protein [Streptomyces violarus]MCT9139836.1 zinc ribbon domain-containing protein [Streptomyces violarus]
MARFRMYPTSEQEQQMLLHCAHARYVWNLAVEQHAHWRRDKAHHRPDGKRTGAPSFAEQCRQLTEARAASEWLRAGNQTVQAQALKDFAKAKAARFTSGFGEPTKRRAARAKKGNERKTAAYAQVAKLRAREANRRKDWCEKTSTMLARTYDVVRFEKLNIKTMTARAKAKPDPGQPGQYLSNGRAAKAGLNRGILAQGWGLLRQRTGHKAPGRVEDVPAPYTSLRCSACGWIDKNSRKSQAEFVCSSCGFTCNADTNASINVAAGQGGIPRPRRSAGAGGVTTATSRSSAREPQPTWVGIPLL